MAMAGAFVRVWGRDWTPTFLPLRARLRAEWAADGRLLFSGGAWHSLFTTIQLRRHRRADHRRPRPARRLGADAPALRPAAPRWNSR
jgi:uncharacterized RDD family membrane protein YckC